MRKTRKSLWLFVCILVFFVHGCARAPHRLTSPTFAARPVLTNQGFFHTVERGQTLYRIAKAYDIEVSDLMRVNHIYNPSQLETGKKLFIPSAAVVAPPPAYPPINLEQIKTAVGPKQVGYVCQTITLHHSGTLQGNARLFDRDHRRRKMGGLFYHFVIGNGTRSSDGLVEVGWRWKKQVKANRPYDIQICLVGNFNRQNVSEVQFQSLVNLIKVLQEEYGIPASRIRRHEDIHGKHTECPGKNFPFDRLRSELSKSNSLFHF